MAGARGEWNSRFGFIMAAVGSAVGLGNLLRFPRELSDNGGAAFLFVYLILLFLVGLPAILGEMSLGKLANSSPVNAFRKLGGEHGKKWRIAGVFAMMGAVFVMFFYTVLAGWALRFFAETFRDGWWDAPTTLFSSVETGPWTVFFHGIVTLFTVFVVARGVSGGIEKASVFMMPALFAIVTGIIVYSLFQDGMGAGYSAIFKPDFSELSPANVSAAVGQVFFSLSLGQGAMLTYASYMDKKQSVTKDGLTIGFADTGVAVMAGMMIFPVLAFTGLLTSSDPTIQEALTGSFGTAFIALPNAFLQMGDVVGRLVGGVFFLGLFFAALSSAISLLEVPVSVMVDNLGVARKKAALFMGIITYTFGILASLNTHFLTLYDEVAVNVFIVIAVAITTFFSGWVAPGVGKELDRGLKSRIGSSLVWMMRTVTPVLIAAVFIIGGFFGGDSGFEFWGEGAGFKELGHTAKLAFGGGGGGH
ncbi:MAG: sodium-dependent transporter [Thermoplasmatota archaeon]